MRGAEPPLPAPRLLPQSLRSGPAPLPPLPSIRVARETSSERLEREICLSNGSSSGVRVLPAMRPRMPALDYPLVIGAAVEALQEGRWPCRNSNTLLAPRFAATLCGT
ncbi:hypothetical protein MTO96_005582 [Rhipicephalus appendiculatus]